MCIVKTPKVDQSAVDAQKKQPQYLRNPWLDGLSIQGGGAAATGRNSLAIDPGSTTPTVAPASFLPTFSNPTAAATVASNPSLTPGLNTSRVNTIGGWVDRNRFDSK